MTAHATRCSCKARLFRLPLLLLLVAPQPSLLPGLLPQLAAAAHGRAWNSPVTGSMHESLLQQAVSKGLQLNEHHMWPSAIAAGHLNLRYACNREAHTSLSL